VLGNYLGVALGAGQPGIDDQYLHWLEPSLPATSGQLVGARLDVIAANYLRFARWLRVGSEAASSSAPARLSSSTRQRASPPVKS